MIMMSGRLAGYRGADALAHRRHGKVCAEGEKHNADNYHRGTGEEAEEYPRFYGRYSEGEQQHKADYRQHCRQCFSQLFREFFSCVTQQFVSFLYRQTMCGYACAFTRSKIIFYLYYNITGISQCVAKDKKR